MLEDEAEDGEHVRLVRRCQRNFAILFEKLPRSFVAIPGSPGGGPGGRARPGPCRSRAPGRSWGVSS